jgi:hypothetical protein
MSINDVEQTFIYNGPVRPGTQIEVTSRIPKTYKPRIMHIESEFRSQLLVMGSYMGGDCSFPNINKETVISIDEIEARWAKSSSFLPAGVDLTLYFIFSDNTPVFDRREIKIQLQGPSDIDFDKEHPRACCDSCHTGKEKQ